MLPGFKLAVVRLAGSFLFFMVLCHDMVPMVVAPDFHGSALRSPLQNPQIPMVVNLDLYDSVWSGLGTNLMY